MPALTEAPRETALILADLIKSYMELDDDVVALYNQKRKLPPKSGLFIDIAVLGERQYAVNTKPVNDPAQPDLLEVQTIGQREILQIDIFSADEQARLRRIDIIFALTGIDAQRTSEKYALKISRIPQSFVDVSQVEGAARLNRYALTVTVLRAYSRARTSPTFTVFQNPPQVILVNP